MDHRHSSTKTDRPDAGEHELLTEHERRRRLRNERLRLWRKDLRRRRFELDDAGTAGRFAS